MAIHTDDCDCPTIYLEPDYIKYHTCDKASRTAGTNQAESSASSYTFDNYQDDASTTAIYPNAGEGRESATNYVTLGLVGEAGEISNKWKKLYRDAPNFATHPAEYYEFYANLREDILEELGDVLWYCAQLATELGVLLGEVAAGNYRKLTSRRDRGMIKGSGDNR